MTPRETEDAVHPVAVFELDRQIDLPPLSGAAGSPALSEYLLVSETNSSVKWVVRLLQTLLTHFTLFDLPTHHAAV
ncbi:hypothetical protein [Halococcus thailandensis]|uniref:Uncharacterized protein n=1 Tax=Halococcus thailandensis JCM 13552 TaxID=1227457 RepID=M0NHH8_9EURY|nr:hypothetical protein [Halococcus thailandensis]EMA56100.1 hypothetical protein C451_04019 [Halococcus thailandensis JCM 13552]